MKKLIYTCIVSLLFFSSKSQPVIQWQNSYGGTSADHLNTGGRVFNNLSLTNDGGYIFAGNSQSDDGDVSNHHGTNSVPDFWVVKLDSTGTIEWEKSLGGTGDDDAEGVIQTSDGGYIVIGRNSSNDGDVMNHYGGVDTSDAWIVKLDASGNIEWEKSFGGSDHDIGTQIMETSYGYLFLGDTRSSDGDVSTNLGAIDIWLVKIDTAGNVLWEKTYGGTGGERPSTVHMTTDGGYIVSGFTTSSDGDVQSNQFPGFLPIAWFLKVDSAGNIEWERTIGGSLFDTGSDAWQTSDGGYVLLSSSTSSDGDATCTHGSGDIHVMKVDASGNMEWSQCYGGTGNDAARSIRQMPDLGYIISGATGSTDGDVSSLIGAVDCWLIKTDSIGNIEWEKTYGGSLQEDLTGVVTTPDGGYVIAGESLSNDFDVSGHHGATSEFDIWIAKLSSFATGVEEVVSVPVALSVYPNPFTKQTMITLTLSSSEKVIVNVYDLFGRTVTTVVEKRLGQGNHAFSLNMEGAANGMYMISVQTSEDTIVQKLLLEQ